MTEASAAAFAAENVRELDELVRAADPAAIDALTDAVLAARRVFCTGAGRSGLMAKAVAMRLMHTGLTAYATGEIATPAIGEGDLLFAVTANGSGSVLAQARTAVKTGATVVAITSRRESELAELASHLLVLPARTEVATRQHAGSLFEQASLVVGDAVCRAVQARLDVPTSELDARHANLT